MKIINLPQNGVLHYYWPLSGVLDLNCNSLKCQLCLWFELPQFSFKNDFRISATDIDFGINFLQLGLIKLFLSFSGLPPSIRFLKLSVSSPPCFITTVSELLVVLDWTLTDISHITTGLIILWFSITFLELLLIPMGPLLPPLTNSIIFCFLMTFE